MKGVRSRGRSRLCLVQQDCCIAGNEVEGERDRVALSSLMNIQFCLVRPLAAAGSRPMSWLRLQVPWRLSRLLAVIVVPVRLSPHLAILSLSLACRSIFGYYPEHDKVDRVNRGNLVTASETRQLTSRLLIFRNCIQSFHYVVSDFLSSSRFVCFSVSRIVFFSVTSLKHESIQSSIRSPIYIRIRRFPLNYSRFDHRTFYEKKIYLLPQRVIRDSSIIIQHQFARIKHFVGIRDFSVMELTNR